MGAVKMGPKYDASETRQLLDLYQDPKNTNARDRLVADHLPLVRRLCLRFSRSGEPLEDLVQVGTIGLLKAIEKYDPDRGSSLIAFAVPLIVGEIKNYFRDHGWAVKVPRKLQRHRLLVEKAVASLSQILSRGPNIPEIVEATGLSEEEVYETFEVGKYGKPLSLDALHDGHAGEDGSSLLDTLGSEDPEFDKLTDKIDLANALRCLDKREKTIIYLKFYAGLPQTKIAEVMGVSQMQVSRLQRDALSKVKLNMEKYLFWV